MKIQKQWFNMKRQSDIDDCVDVMLNDVWTVDDFDVLEDVRKEIDRLLTDGISLSFNPQILPDKFYTVKSKRDFKELFFYMKLKFETDFSLNWIDVSKIKNMSELFIGEECNFDISRWDVSHVTNMSFMFYASHFNNDISSWDVFNVKNAEDMFNCSKFNSDISNWKLNNNCVSNYMFQSCPIKPEFKPKCLNS